jgi:hypothetical protein
MVKFSAQVELQYPLGFLQIHPGPGSTAMMHPDTLVTINLHFEVLLIVIYAAQKELLVYALRGEKLADK